MVQINDASEVRRLVKANDSFDRESEINDTFPKNHSLFQFYINVEGNDHLNGFYSFDDLLCRLGSISEDEYINARDEYEDIKIKLENHISLKCELMKQIERNDINTTLEKVLNDELYELEEQESEIRNRYIQWEDQETLIENICINLRKCVYWTFFNENQQKQYPDGFLFIPKISNQTIELLDNIFCQSDQMDTITNNQINKHLSDYELVNTICEDYNNQIIELGETVELLEATEEEENETDDESVWETTSIDENENPDKSDATSESSEASSDDDNFSELDDEPLKLDECKTCKNYAYLIEELRQKDKKIANLQEIIRAQDKQIEEHDEENDSDEENEWEAQYNGLKESFDEYIEEKNEEEKEHRKTIVDYALRVNALIDEVRELRKKQNLSTDNI